MNHRRLTRTRKFAATFVVLGTSASIAWASCGGTEGLVLTAAGSLASSVVAALSASATSLITTDEMQTEMMLASIKVLTKQIEVSGERTGTVTVQAEQSAAQVVNELGEKELIDKMVVDFSSQGFDPCGQSAATRRLATAEVAAIAAVPMRIKTEIDAVGGKYGSVADALVGREKQHQDLFCTQDEVDAGACSKLGVVPGGDTNAALLFDGSTDPNKVAARNAVINGIIGLPSNPIPASAVNTPEAAAYILEKKQKDAFLAFPAYSLKSIQTDNEQYKAVMEERLGQYFGTDKAAQWAKDQAGQAQRGVLIDLVKMQGLQLKIRERRLKQGMRMEANVAGLLELENQQSNKVVTERAAQQASTEAATQKVK